jgi:large repetitive protein
MEQCDDGNTMGLDGCAGNCMSEGGWSCAGEPSTCGPICGDWYNNGPEVCDDGNAVGGDGCSANCQTVEPGWNCLGTGQGFHVGCSFDCGNGITNIGEECDDGNLDDGDGCDSTCHAE